MDADATVKKFQEILDSITQKPGVIPAGQKTKSTFLEWYRHNMNTFSGHVNKLEYLNYKSQAATLRGLVLDAQAQNPKEEEYRVRKNEELQQVQRERGW
jgi:hypothetical protein